MDKHPIKLPDSIKSALETVPIPADKFLFFVYDKEGVILYASPKIGTVTDYGGTRIIGMNIRDIIFPGYGSQNSDSLDERFFKKTDTPFPVNLLAFMDKTPNVKSDIFIFKNGIPGLMKVHKVEEYFLAGLYPITYFMERAIGRITEDMMAILDENNEIIVFNDLFARALLPDDTNEKLMMEQLTDPDKWYKLLNRENEVINYYKQLAEEPAEEWVEIKNFDTLKSSDWIPDLGSEWSLKGNTFQTNPADGNSYITYLNNVEQVKNDVIISFDADLSDFKTLGILFHVNIYRASTEMSYPDLEGYNFQLTEVYRPFTAVNLKKSGNNIGQQRVDLAKLIKEKNIDKKAVPLRFEKAGGAFNFYVAGEKLATLYDTHPITSPHYNYFGIMGGKNTVFKNMKVLTRSSLFMPEKIPPETMDLQFYRFPGYTFETRLGNLSIAAKRMKYVYMKDVTYSRELMSKVNKYVKEIDEELTTAKRIHFHLTNIPIPKDPNIDFSYVFKPSGKVGGDMLDIKDLGNHKYAILIYDVSGHGIAASLISSMTKMSFDNAFKQTISPSKIIQLVNLDICAVTEPSIFLTAFLGVIDLADSTFTYSRAGHCIPAVFSPDKDQPLTLDEGSTVIGNSEDFEFPECTISLEENNRILLYTDGLVEIRNKKDMFFGKKRLFDLVKKCKDQSIEDIKFRILKEIDAFLGKDVFEDDITFLLVDIKRLGGLRAKRG